MSPGRFFACSNTRTVLRTALLLLAPVFWLLSSALTPLPSHAAEFTAELVRSTGEEEGEVSRVFVKGDRRREEYMDEGDAAGVAIFRGDLGVVWTLMSEEKVYLEVRAQRGMSAPLESLSELNRLGMKQVLGRETVNGHDCEKRRYSPRDPNQGTLTLWYSETLGYPVMIKVDIPGEEQQLIQFRRIEPVPVPDSKFEIPKGYSKVSMPQTPKR